MHVIGNSFLVTLYHNIHLGVSKIQLPPAGFSTSITSVIKSLTLFPQCSEIWRLSWNTPVGQNNKAECMILTKTLSVVPDLTLLLLRDSWFF